MARERGKVSARINQRVSKVTDNIGERKTLLGLIVLAVGAFLAFVAFISTTGPPFQSKYQIQVSLPADSPVMRVGQAVRIGGKLAGLVSAVEPDREDGGTTVTANITKTGFRPLPEDTTAYVRVHSIVYETYLELRPGESPDALENGDALQEQATSGVDLLEVVQLFDAEARQALKDTVVNVGFGAAGRGAELNEALADLPELSRDASAQLQAATSDEGALGETVAGAAGTASGLRGVRSDDVEALIGSADATVGTVADRREDLRRTIQLLRPFEDQFLSTAPRVTPLLEDLEVVSRELEPAVRSLNAQLPSINRLLDLGGVLAAETTAIADASDPVLLASRPVVFGLFPTLTALAPLNANLDILRATVEPYAAEITSAGRRLANATGRPIPEGEASGAPAGRVVPVVTPHPCKNPIPDPGEAENDVAVGGQCN